MKKGILLVLVLIITISFTGCMAGDLTSQDTIYIHDGVVEGNLTLNSPFWAEINTPANECGIFPGDAPTAANCQAGFVYLYADQALPANETYVHFNVLTPHDYVDGSNLTFRVHFVFNSDQVGTCIRWKLAYSWANDGEAYPVSTNIWALTNPSNNDSLINNYIDFTPVSGAGKTSGSTLLCYLSRNSSDVSDNYTDTAIFVSVGVRYQTNKVY